MKNNDECFESNPRAFGSTSFSQSETSHIINGQIFRNMYTDSLERRGETPLLVKRQHSSGKSKVGWGGKRKKIYIYVSQNTSKRKPRTFGLSREVAPGSAFEAGVTWLRPYTSGSSMVLPLRLDAQKKKKENRKINISVRINHVCSWYAFLSVPCNESSAV